MIYGVSVDEKGLKSDNEYVKKADSFAKNNKAVAIKLCAKIKEELVGLEDSLKRGVFRIFGHKKYGLEQIVWKCFF